MADDRRIAYQGWLPARGLIIPEERSPDWIAGAQRGPVEFAHVLLNRVSQMYELPSFLFPLSSYGMPHRRSGLDVEDYFWQTNEGHSPQNRHLCKAADVRSLSWNAKVNTGEYSIHVYGHSLYTSEPKVPCRSPHERAWHVL